MKRTISLLLSLLFLCGIVLSAAAAVTTKPTASFFVSLPVRFDQTEARKLFDMINAFRTGDNAWYWNEGDKAKVQASGLSALQYDEALEQVAMQRAAEIALCFSHMRPNGKLCFSAYGDCEAAAENLAYGQQNAKQVHEAWLEEKEPYDGQGHRRNMLLPNVEAVGIACVVFNNMRFWVEAFRTPATAGTKPDPKDGETTVRIEIAPDSVKTYEATLSAEKLALKVDETSVAPTLRLKLRLNDGVTDANLTLQPEWKSSKETVASVLNGYVGAFSAGSCELTATVHGNKLTVPVTVEAAATQPEKPAEDPTEPSATQPEKPADEPTEPPATEPTETQPTHEHVSEVLPPVTPTCVTTGLSVGTRCKICGKVLQEQQVLPKLSHNYSEKRTKAGFHKKGKVLRTCDVCGHRETTEIPAVASVRLSATKYVFDGKRHTPKVRVLDENGATLQRDIDYKLTYPGGRKEVGTYQIKLTLKGAYKGSKKLTFKILPQAVTALNATPGKKSAVLQWEAAPGATHYVVYYSATSSGGYKKLGTTAKTSASMVQLDSGKAYYFRVRAIARTDDDQWNGALSVPVRVVAK